MRNKLTIAFILGVIFHVISGCSIKWTEAIRYGEIANKEFNEKVPIEIKNGLIFLPISIHGKEYRFLFDSGAPFSISNQLQNDYAFKIISKGNIIDSDHNRKKVNWAQVDSITIGDVSFLNQVAFIGDFDANPLMNCLGIDGIIGSNLIRQCNWKINQKQNSLSLFDSIDKHAFKEHVTIPFKSDYQYNIFIDITFGQSIVRNILMDYGSNGAIALNNEIFATLKDRDIISEIFLENGIQQSGIIGEAVDLSRKITFTDSISINRVQMKNVMLRTGKTVSVGNELLSRFQVIIDWDNQKLYLAENGKISYSNRSPGFKLGYSTDKGIYVQSVIEGSNAYKKGIRPNMQVIKVDNLDFGNGDDFCNYVRHEFGEEIFLLLIDSHEQKLEYHFEKTIF